MQTTSSVKVNKGDVAEKIVGNNVRDVDVRVTNREEEADANTESWMPHRMHNRIDPRTMEALRDEMSLIGGGSSGGSSGGSRRANIYGHDGLGGPRPAVGKYDSVLHKAWARRHAHQRPYPL